MYLWEEVISGSLYSAILATPYYLIFQKSILRPYNHGVIISFIVYGLLSVSWGQQRWIWETTLGEKHMLFLGKFVSNDVGLGITKSCSIII